MANLESHYLTQKVQQIAQVIYKECTFEELVILGDALEDAGCDNVEILEHCRSKDPYFRGSWVLDLILGKE